MKITIIIPLRITDGVYQAQERLKRIISNAPSNKFNILIIDYGTPESYKHLLSDLDGDNVKVLSFEVHDKIFNIGHARDLGVQYSSDEVVMFNDIDFFGNREMYNNIYNEVASRDIEKNAYDFFCVPVFFLTENGSTSALEEENNLNSNNHLFHRKITESHNDFVDFPAYGSSAIVVNKRHYLGIGGHSREFYGHGAEDYDLLHRLSSYYVKGPRTADYYQNTRSNNIDSYRGFRAYFALHGIDIFNRGIFFLHLWHPKRTVPGYHQTQRNFSLLEDLMKKYDQFKIQPFPLGDLNKPTKALILVESDSQTFKAIRHALPLLGDITIMSEKFYETPDDLINYFNNNKFDHILFLNPYGNTHRLSLYLEVKINNIPFIIFDRGALPNSWFFDSNGFNYDSSSYHFENWNNPLSLEDTIKTKDYLFSLCNGEHTLEHNSPRKTARYYREHYKIGNRKVLFVPFQRPTDTVTTYFAGPAESVYGFQEWVSFVSENLPKNEWVIICKNHPLEKDLPKIPDVIYADNDAHIHDLIDLSDAVFLMNSGVGLISLAFMKPVICASHSFYSHPGLAKSATSKENALELIKENSQVNQDKVYQFFNHIISNIYSFGSSKYRKTKAADGSDRSIVNEIIFEKINIASNEFIFSIPPKGVSLDAPLFYSFGGRNTIKNTLSSAGLKHNKTIKENDKLVKKVTSISSTAESKNAVAQNITRTNKMRKLRKLINNPTLFFKDAIIKRQIKAEKIS